MSFLSYSLKGSSAEHCDVTVEPGTHKHFLNLNRLSMRDPTHEDKTSLNSFDHIVCGVLWYSQNSTPLIKIYDTLESRPPSQKSHVIKCDLVYFEFQFVDDSHEDGSHTGLLCFMFFSQLASFNSTSQSAESMTESVSPPQDDLWWKWPGPTILKYWTGFTFYNRRSWMFSEQIVGRNWLLTHLTWG